MTKYALITGASRGLGKAIALRLANDGFAVIINYQSNKEAAEDTLRQVQEAGGTGELLPFNVADPQAIETALESWSASHPDDYISVLVNNAGIRQDNLMIFMQEEQWSKVLDTTLNGFFYITRRLLKDMMTHRDQLFRRQGCSHRSHQGFGTGSGSPQGDRQCHRSWVHRHRYDQGTRRGRVKETHPVGALRQARGSGRFDQLPRFRRCRLHHGAGDFY